MTALPLGQARDQFSKVLDGVERTHDRVTVTRHGKPVAVIMAASDLEALEETLAILSSAAETAQIRAGLADLEHGRVESWAEMRAEFGNSSPGVTL